MKFRTYTLRLNSSKSIQESSFYSANTVYDMYSNSHTLSADLEKIYTYYTVPWRTVAGRPTKYYCSWLSMLPKKKIKTKTIRKTKNTHYAAVPSSPFFFRQENREPPPGKMRLAKRTV